MTLILEGHVLLHGERGQLLSRNVGVSTGRLVILLLLLFHLELGFLSLLVVLVHHVVGQHELMGVAVGFSGGFRG